MAKLFANSGDPDQTPHDAASDLGLHCLPNTLFGVSRLKWILYQLYSRWQMWKIGDDIYKSSMVVTLSSFGVR